MAFSAIRGAASKLGRWTPTFDRYNCLVFIACLVSGLAIIMHSAMAQVAGQATDQDGATSIAWRVDPGQIWAFFFLLLGPIKIIVPFLNISKNGDTAFVRKLAFRGTIYACAVLFAAACVGVPMLHKYHLPPPVLALAGGIIIFLIALRTLVDQISGAANPISSADPEPTLRLAFSPLAFPIIITPAGIAAVIVFLALAPDTSSDLVIVTLLIVIIALDFFAMLFARLVVRWVAMPLQVFGAVLGIVQLAVGLHVIMVSLNAVGIITYHAK